MDHNIRNVELGRTGCGFSVAPTAGLTVTDDQLALAAADGDEAVDSLAKV